MENIVDSDSDKGKKKLWCTVKKIEKGRIQLLSTESKLVSDTHVKH